MKPFLSLCLIVKNEEKVLRRCLESVKGIVDEIVIADTGSTDSTKNIAHEYTNLVFDYKWENDFSKARNFAASEATGEWIIVMDADEYVDRESFIKFVNEFKEKPPVPNILAVEIVNFVGANGADTILNFHERIYKNDGTIRYYRNVHELLYHINSLENKGVAPLKLYHSGYMQGTIKDKDKSKRNLSLLKSKENKEAIDYYFLGNEYNQLKDYNQAIKYYKLGFQLKTDMNLDWVLKLLIRLINCLELSNRYAEALEVIDACEEYYLNFADFKYFKGRILMHQGKTDEAVEIFEGILFNKITLQANTSQDFLDYWPHRYLADLYEKLGQTQLSVTHYSKALSINDTDDSLWARFLELIFKHSSIEEFISFMNRTILTRKSMNNLRIAKILNSIPLLEAQKISQQFYQEENTIEFEALRLKGLLLDQEFLELKNSIGELTLNQLVEIFSTGIFNVIDFILLTLQLNDEKYKKILVGLNLREPLVNLFNLLLNGKSKKLKEHEENALSKVIKQGEIIGLESVVKSLELKRKILRIKRTS